MLDQTPRFLSELSPALILIVSQLKHRLRSIAFIRTRSRLAALLPDIAALPQMAIWSCTRRIGCFWSTAIEGVLSALRVTIVVGRMRVERLVQRAELLPFARAEMQEVGEVDEERGTQEVGEDIAPLELFPLTVSWS